jgi:hypothetical protein
MAIEDSYKEESEEEFEEDKEEYEEVEEEIEEAEVDYQEELLSAIEVIRREKSLQEATSGTRQERRHLGIRTNDQKFEGSN